MSKLISIILTTSLSLVYLYYGEQSIFAPLYETIIIVLWALIYKNKLEAVATFAIFEFIAYIITFWSEYFIWRCIALIYWFSFFFIWKEYKWKGLMIWVVFHYLWNYSEGFILMIVLGIVSTYLYYNLFDYGESNI